ncbi:f-box/kelch-repeat protein [Quercus suber]|uniref:F-box/kelch-repeat protein n=1 Tax=Quercus suber TaxID=58331 RepID=A0AAW0MB31_QUESU
MDQTPTKHYSHNFDHNKNHQETTTTRTTRHWPQQPQENTQHADSTLGVKKKKITTNNNSSSCSSSFTPKKISPVSKVAEDRPPGPYPSRYYAVLDDHLYSVGGPDPDFSASTIPDVYENYTLSPDSPLNIVSSIPTTEVWMLDLKCPGKGWERAPSMKYRRQNPQTIVVDGKLYVFGGLGWLQPKDTFSGWMEFYDPKLRTWETLPNPPTYSKIDMDVIFAHSSFKGKDQIIINGPPVLEEGDSNGKAKHTAMVRPVLHIELGSSGFLRIEYTAQQRKSRGLEGKEEGGEEEEEREEGEMRGKQSNELERQRSKRDTGERAEA